MNTVRRKKSKQKRNISHKCCCCNVSDGTLTRLVVYGLIAVIVGLVVLVVGVTRTCYCDTNVALNCDSYNESCILRRTVFIILGSVVMCVGLLAVLFSSFLLRKESSQSLVEEISIPLQSTRRNGIGFTKLHAMDINPTHPSDKVYYLQPKDTFLLQPGYNPQLYPPEQFQPPPNAPVSYPNTPVSYPNTRFTYSNTSGIYPSIPVDYSGTPMTNYSGTPMTNYPGTPMTNYPGTPMTNYSGTLMTNYPGSTEGIYPSTAQGNNTCEPQGIYCAPQTDFCSNSFAPTHSNTD